MEESVQNEAKGHSSKVEHLRRGLTLLRESVLGAGPDPALFADRRDGMALARSVPR